MPDSPTIYLPLQVAKALALARCDDPVRYGIDKVLVKVGDGTVDFVATDAHMLLKVTLPHEGILEDGTYHIEPDRFLLLAKAPINYCPHALEVVQVTPGDGGFPDYAQVVPADDQSRPNKDAGMNAKLLKSTGLITEWLTCEMEAKPTGYGYKKRAGSAFGRSLTWSHSSPLAPVRFDLPKDAEYLYEAATVVVMPMRLG